MWMRNILLGAVSLLGSLDIVTQHAVAATYSWTISSSNPNLSGSGTLLTDVDVGPATVTSFSGTFGGQATTLLGVGTLGGNDNILNQLTQPELTENGIAFTNTFFNIRLFFAPAFNPLDYLIYCDTGSGPCGSREVGFSIVAVPSVPVPAALPLLATGLGALGVIGWRRKRKQAEAHA